MIAKYKSFTDSQHGWLKVRKSELVELGVASDISRYSYERGDYAYLEEDRDVSVFVRAWEAKHGLTFSAKDHTNNSYSDHSSIRGYASYSAVRS